MAEKNRTILKYFVLLLLGAAFITYGAYTKSKAKSIRASVQRKEYAMKLNELKANLIQSAKGGSHRQDKRTSTGKSPKARST